MKSAHDNRKISGFQAGQLQKQEHRLTTGNSLIVGYEYTYDLLGRVVSSLELPSEDETEYEYWSSGRLKKEERTGTISYVREYTYHPDGSRATVIRNDALNGEHEEEYAYDEDTGHLLSVTDTVPNPPQVHTFVWNINGTLSRWTDPTENFDRVFSYDEEGRLTSIEHDDGQSSDIRYEYQYTGDGVRYLKKDHVASKEYRYGCSIDCGGTPLRVYERTLGSQGSWTSLEDYLQAGNALGYGLNWQTTFSNGSLLMMGSQASPSQFIAQDAANTVVVQDSPPSCLCLVPAQSVCSPFASDCGSACSYNDEGYIVNMHGQGGLPAFGISFNQYQPNVILGPILIAALRGCAVAVGLDVLGDVVAWLGCVISQFLRGQPLEGCGPFPVPELCDVLSSCITGALTGGLLEKIIPRALSDAWRDIWSGVAGNLGKGICQSMSLAPVPCQAPKPAPIPKPVGGYRPPLPLH